MNEPPVLQPGKWRQRLTRVRAAARRAVPFVSGVVAAFAALLLYNALVPGPHLITQRDVNDTIAQAMASATPAPAYSSLVFDVIRPSVVLIQTQGKDTSGKAEHALGTGVVVDDAGDILTSLHVVDGADEIQLIFADGTHATGQIAVKQPENDIAVVHPNQLPKVLVPATLGNPNAMRVGDEAYVVGNPFGLYASMSAGIISGFDRSFQMPNSTRKLEKLIQIDAAVNPGNSGGPLLNRYGQVVGIVAALLNPSEQDFFVGIGFAVPITTAGGAAGLPPD